MDRHRGIGVSSASPMCFQELLAGTAWLCPCWNIAHADLTWCDGA